MVGWMDYLDDAMIFVLDEVDIICFNGDSETGYADVFCNNFSSWREDI